MMHKSPFLTLFACLTLASVPLWAQDGETADRYATTPTGEDWDEWDDINPDAWDSFVSFDMERYFGQGDQQDFIVDFQYESQTVIWGTQAAQQSIKPRIQWLGPLFGGDGYTSVEGIIPMDSGYSQQLWIYGGWKYHLTPVVDVDVGGNIVLANNKNYGPGIPTPWGSGWGERGTIYMGLIGNFFLHPSAYFIYDMSLDQKILLLGVEQDWDLHEVLGAPEGLILDFQMRFGWLQANGWLGPGRTPQGQQWRNGYCYMTSKLDLIYQMDNGVSTYIGVRQALNNDGQGAVGINGISMGPESMVWFGAGVSYEF